MLNSLSSRVKTVPKPVDYTEKFERMRKWLAEQRRKAKEPKR